MATRRRSAKKLRELRAKESMTILSNYIKDENEIFRIPVIIIGVSLFLQIILGIFTILSGVKILYASLHQINSILIILSTLYFLYITKYKKID